MTDAQTTTIVTEVPFVPVPENPTIQMQIVVQQLTEIRREQRRQLLSTR